MIFDNIHRTTHASSYESSGLRFNLEGEDAENQSETIDIFDESELEDNKENQLDYSSSPEKKKTRNAPYPYNVETLTEIVDLYYGKKGSKWSFETIRHKWRLAPADEKNMKSRKITRFVTKKVVDDENELLEKCTLFVAEVQHILENTDHRKVFNTDQTAMKLEMRSGRTLAVQGEKKWKQLRRGTML
ncbi:hypothetical protein QR680_015669 [Steinernema hermaphroditum]|uniref:Uncharacterized protein n=1 Tax=Steinernema hermaphroditum TaxID=289476 RepID=A0AA39LL06_9BILA|nr:hypothetical protein QR680_015669 [Steinernema hermaphroditum]